MLLLLLLRTTVGTVVVLVVVPQHRSSPSKRCPWALLLNPTRELALPTARVSPVVFFSF